MHGVGRINVRWPLNHDLAGQRKAEHNMMRAGLPQPAQQQLSVAARNAEALFEAKTVGEIRQVGQQQQVPTTNPCT